MLGNHQGETEHGNHKQAEHDGLLAPEQLVLHDGFWEQGAHNLEEDYWAEGEVLVVVWHCGELGQDGRHQEEDAIVDEEDGEPGCW